MIVTIVSVALLPEPTPGTPVTAQIFSSSSVTVGLVSVPKAESIQSVEVDDRLLAGMIGKSVSSPNPGGVKSISIGRVAGQ